jgi:hypothetical protein
MADPKRRNFPKNYFRSEHRLIMFPSVSDYYVAKRGEGKRFMTIHIIARPDIINLEGEAAENFIKRFDQWLEYINRPRVSV